MRRIVFVLCFLTIGIAADAAAETRVRDNGFRDNVIVDDTLLRQGRIEIGIGSAGMWTRDSGESSDGDVSASGSTFYANPSASFGYMALDALQGRLNLGYLSVSTTNNDVNLQNLGAFLGTLQAIYHVNLRLGTALYVGAGGGYFVGSTSRPGAGENVTISNPTSGFAGQGLAGLLLQPGPMFLVRGGLRFDALLGSESSTSDEMPDISTTNLKIMGEFAIGLRF
jgi:hypothetical protein